jgi:hypothetical protein
MTSFRISKSLFFMTGGLVAAVGITTISAASDPIFRTRQQQAAQQTTAQQAATTVTAGELADHPDRYYGKRVKITGEVEDVYSRSVFAIDEDKLWSTGRDVLVLNAHAAGRVNADKSVTVQGIVRPFRYTEVNDYVVGHGWYWELGTAYRTRFTNRPIVVAESIQDDSGLELVREGDKVRSAAADYGKPMTGKPTAAKDHVVHTTPEDISQNPDKYYGKRVSIIGNPEDTYGTQLFSIDEDRVWSTGEDVLVLASNVTGAWEDLAYVQIEGKVTRFAKDEVQKRVDQDRAMLPTFWADFEDRPVIVADSITGPDGQDLMKLARAPVAR